MLGVEHTGRTGVERVESGAIPGVSVEINAVLALADSLCVSADLGDGEGEVGVVPGTVKASDGNDSETDLSDGEGEVGVVPGTVEVGEGEDGDSEDGDDGMVKVDDGEGDDGEDDDDEVRVYPGNVGVSDGDGDGNLESDERLSSAEFIDGEA